MVPTSPTAFLRPMKKAVSAEARISARDTLTEVQRLYDQVPYADYRPNYFPVLKSLGLSEEQLRVFAKDKSALEVGCGGGHISLYLGDFFRTVTGADISEQSLRLARENCTKENVTFLQADLFDKQFLNAHRAAYDFVLCYGVLHHTHDPQKGFERLVQLLKPGGTIVIGVYSRTEVWYRVRRQITLWLAGNDWEKRKRLANKLWYRNKGDDLVLSDGFAHPQVSFHGIAEVYGWIQKSNVAYQGSWPYFELSKYSSLIFGKPLRSEARKGLNYSALSFWLVEALWLLSGKSVMVSVSAKKI